MEQVRPFDIEKMCDTNTKPANTFSGFAGFVGGVREI